MASRVFLRASRSVLAQGRGSLFLSSSQNTHLQILSSSFHSLLQSPNKVDTYLGNALLHHPLLDRSSSPTPKFAREKTTQSRSEGSSSEKILAPVNVKVSKTNGKPEKKNKGAQCRTECRRSVEQLLALANMEPKKMIEEPKMTNRNAKCSYQGENSGLADFANIEPKKMIEMRNDGDKCSRQTEHLVLVDTKVPQPTDEEKSILAEDLMKPVAVKKELLKLKTRCKETQELQKKILHLLMKIDERQQKILGDCADQKQVQILNILNGMKKTQDKSTHDLAKEEGKNNKLSELTVEIVVIVSFLIVVMAFCGLLSFLLPL